MAAWIKEVPTDQLDPSKEYFVSLVRTYGPANTKSYEFWSQPLRGKECWSGKPGIACRYLGDERLVKFITRNNDTMDKSFQQLVAVEVPADADKRWRARKPPRRR